MNPLDGELVMKKDDLFPIVAKVHEMEEEIKLMSEKLDHLYAISLAGSSKIASLLAVQLRENQLGRTLVQDELADTVKRINQEMADDYLKIVRGIQKKNQHADKDGQEKNL